MAEPSAQEAQRIRTYIADASWKPSAARERLVSERRGILERLARAALPPPPELRVCDVGCGAGSDLVHWRMLGVAEERLFGTELITSRAEAARSALPGATIAGVDGFELPFPDGSFDLVTASLVLSTIRDPEGRRRLVSEMRRVTRKGGLLAIYDFRVRKPWNRNVVAVSRAELSETLGPPTATYRLAPFLPFLGLALAMPEPIRRWAVGLLPRTHRLWTWRHDGGAALRHVTRT